MGKGEGRGGMVKSPLTWWFLKSYGTEDGNWLLMSLESGMAFLLKIPVLYSFALTLNSCDK